MIKRSDFPWSNDFFSFIEENTKKSIADLSIVKLAGDASTRTYWRLSHGNQTWVLLEGESFIEHEENYPYLNVQQHLTSHDIHVPKIYAFSSKLGLILLEDFGDNSLEKVTQHLSPKQYAKYYFLALDELFKIHFEASQKNPSCVAFSLDFDIEKLMWELNFMKTHLLEGHLKTSFKKEEEKVLQASFLKLCEHLDHQPKFFTHRDYHSRNLMVVNDRICVLDFQDARMGTCQYDLASLLKDSYVQLPVELIEELIRYYIFEKEKREKKPIDVASFRKTFDWMCIQRNLKAMGSFAYLHSQKGKSGYLKYLKPTWGYVEENLEKFGDFKELHLILEERCAKL